MGSPIGNVSVMMEGSSLDGEPNLIILCGFRLFKGEHQVEQFRLTNFSAPVQSLKIIAFVYLTEANKTKQTIENPVFIPLFGI